MTRFPISIWENQTDNTGATLTCARNSSTSARSPRRSLPASPRPYRTPRRVAAISLASHPSDSAHSRPANVASPAPTGLRRGDRRRFSGHHLAAGGQKQPARAARQAHHGRERRRRAQEIAQAAHRGHVLRIAGHRLTQGLGRFLAVRFDPGRPRRQPKAQRSLTGVENGPRAARLHRSHQIGVEVGRRAGGQAAAQRPQVAGCNQFSHQGVQRRQMSGADGWPRLIDLGVDAGRFIQQRQVLPRLTGHFHEARHRNLRRPARRASPGRWRRPGSRSGCSPRPEQPARGRR